MLTWCRSGEDEAVEGLYNAMAGAIGEAAEGAAATRDFFVAEYCLAAVRGLHTFAMERGVQDTAGDIHRLSDAIVGASLPIAHGELGASKPWAWMWTGHRGEQPEEGQADGFLTNSVGAWRCRLKALRLARQCSLASPQRAVAIQLEIALDGWRECCKGLPLGLAAHGERSILLETDGDTYGRAACARAWALLACSLAVACLQQIPPQGSRELHSRFDIEDILQKKGSTVDEMVCCLEEPQDSCRRGLVVGDDDDEAISILLEIGRVFVGASTFPQLQDICPAISRLCPTALFENHALPMFGREPAMYVELLQGNDTLFLTFLMLVLKHATNKSCCASPEAHRLQKSTVALLGAVHDHVAALVKAGRFPYKVNPLLRRLSSVTCGIHPV